MGEHVSTRVNPKAYGNFYQKQSSEVYFNRFVFSRLAGSGVVIFWIFIFIFAYTKTLVTSLVHTSWLCSFRVSRDPLLLSIKGISFSSSSPRSGHRFSLPAACSNCCFKNSLSDSWLLVSRKLHKCFVPNLVWQANSVSTTQASALTTALSCATTIWLMKLWIYEIHIFQLRNEEINIKILAVINATYAVAKRKPEKIRLARQAIYHNLTVNLPSNFDWPHHGNKGY